MQRWTASCPMCYAAGQRKSANADTKSKPFARTEPLINRKKLNKVT
ncbi:hypothetical protein [Lysinibacillus sp. FSL K6-0102]